MRRQFALLLAAALLVAVAAALWQQMHAVPPAAPTYTGSARCGSCHADILSRWQSSHHAQAMAPANANTVLGDFSDVRDAAGTRFFERQGRYFIATTEHAEPLPVEWTFGVYPLQQYLVPGGQGALQAYTTAWDSRPREQGGQRWFELHDVAARQPQDALHWAQPAQNWNHMCADCHATALRKNYDAATGRFDTRWAEADVGCEACHGPGSAHADWAQRAARWGRLAGVDPGLPVALARHDEAARKAAVLNPARPLHFDAGVEVQGCAACHSRRTQIAAEHRAGDDYYDDYKPELLSAQLYEADGQQHDEVYEWSSFQQSRMFGKGVVCSDCHEPHAARLRAEGNALCLRCHDARLETPQHLMHAAGTPGGRCVDCHMPTRSYMRIDARRDHSLRVPRPDLSLRYGTPNACDGCHHERGGQWAADVLARQYGAGARGLQQYTPALHAIRTQAPQAEAAIQALWIDAAVPDIVKATALSEAGPYLHNGLADLLREALRADNPLLRLGALQALESAEPTARWALAAPLLQDSRRAVRVEAARILGAVPPEAIAEAQRLDPAWREFVAVVNLNADRAEWHAVYAAALAGRGEAAQAIRELQTALRLDPGFIAAYANLADVWREAGDEQACEATLQQGLARTPQDAALHAALGLLRLRQHDREGALAQWREAMRIEPGNGMYASFYATVLAERDPQAAQRFLAQQLAGPVVDRGLLYQAAALALDQHSPLLASYRQRLLPYAAVDAQASRLVEAIDAGR